MVEISREIRLLDIFQSWQAVVVLVGLSTVIVVCLAWIARLRKDAQGQVEDESQTIYQSLREAYERGQMADEEFERIRANLGVPPDRWPDLKRKTTFPEPFEPGEPQS